MWVGKVGDAIPQGWGLSMQWEMGWGTMAPPNFHPRQGIGMYPLLSIGVPMPLPTLSSGGLCSLGMQDWNEHGPSTPKQLILARD